MAARHTKFTQQLNGEQRTEHYRTMTNSNSAKNNQKFDREAFHQLGRSFSIGENSLENVKRVDFIWASPAFDIVFEKYITPEELETVINRVTVALNEAGEMASEAEYKMGYTGIKGNPEPALYVGFPKLDGFDEPEGREAVIEKLKKIVEAHEYALEHDYSSLEIHGDELGGLASHELEQKTIELVKQL